MYSIQNCQRQCPVKELRQAWQVADPQQEHVNQFIDMHDIGDALIRAGFGQPVMDVELFTLTYDQPIKVLKDLKAISATHANTNRGQGLMGKTRFQTMLNAYESFRQKTLSPQLLKSYTVTLGRLPNSLKGQTVISRGMLKSHLRIFHSR